VSLVPKQFRQHEAIINNQKYYLALKLREETKIKYNTRVKLTTALLEGVYITGTINTFMEVQELFDYVDFDKLMYNLVLGGNDA
jgi:hypothetical protein